MLKRKLQEKDITVKEKASRTATTKRTVKKASTPEGKLPSNGNKTKGQEAYEERMRLLQRRKSSSAHKRTSLSRNTSENSVKSKSASFTSSSSLGDDHWLGATRAPEGYEYQSSGASRLPRSSRVRQQSFGEQEEHGISAGAPSKPKGDATGVRQNSSFGGSRRVRSIKL